MVAKFWYFINDNQIGFVHKNLTVLKEFQQF